MRLHHKLMSLKLNGVQNAFWGDIHSDDRTSQRWMSAGDTLGKPIRSWKLTVVRNSLSEHAYQNFGIVLTTASQFDQPINFSQGSLDLPRFTRRLLQSSIPQTTDEQDF